MSKMKPGVVYGETYKELLQSCKDGGYALPAVNVVGSNSINAVMEAAANNSSDIIIQLSNGGAQFMAGQGLADGDTAKVVGGVAAANHVHLLAEYYGICVVLHTDHANRKLLPWIDGLIDAGAAYYKANGRPLYSSHMLDLSEEALEDNLSTCAEYLKKLVPLEMSLEIELGVTGGEEDGVGSDEDFHDNPKLYTQPDDVLQAYDLLSPIGHFSVAASFGNVHGVYKPGNVHLRPEILKNSQELISQSRDTKANPLDLVFHGGSGSEKAKIEEAIGYGVIKMNIDTDTQFAFATAVGAYVEKTPRAFSHQIDPDDDKPYKSVYDPRKWLRQGELSVVERLDEACADLHSAGKSLAKN
ncbi:MAG: class II fructose-bisphosphate aldolase [Alphaproteobacteria bacterium]|nr:class II fructose-bisphosphate aldolase [Alphaproteobacteria bacterium]